MKRMIDKRKTASAIVVIMLFSISIMFGLIASASSSANNFGVEDASGYKNTNVLVPVNITNVHSESIVGIEFKFLYDKNVINLVGMQKGVLTSDWGEPFKAGSEGDYVVGIVGTLSNAIANGSTGSMVVLNFTVIGESGETSGMNIANIKLVNSSWDETGTAPAKNGTFTVLESPTIPNKNVVFLDSSIGGDEASITGWEWNFYYYNCTLLDTSYQQNVTYTFPDYGEYYVELIVTNECGESDSTGLLCINTGCPIPEASFTHTAFAC